MLSPVLEKRNLVIRTGPKEIDFRKHSRSRSLPLGIMKCQRSRRCFPPKVLLHIVISGALFCMGASQREGFVVGPFRQNRFFSWSTEAPLARAVNELEPAAIPHIDLLIQHVTRAESAVLQALKRERFILDEPVQPCDPAIEERYRTSIPRSFGVLGFPDPGANCASDVPGVNFDNAPPGYTLEDLYHAVFGRGAEIKKRAEEVAFRLIDNFTRPEVPFNFTHNTMSAQCSLTPVCMYRVGEFWHQEIGIQSHGQDEHVPDGKRNLIAEYLRVVDGKLADNLLLRLPKYDNGSIERVIVDNTTTMIQTARRPNPSCFREVPIEENPAMIQALDDVDHFAQQAEDALTSSNLAILLLPLSLNLVPISLFTNVSSRAMLLFILMSDVLTIIPLGIKGIELVIISSSRFRAVITRITSGARGNVTSTEAAAGEIWGAECRVRDRVRQTGIVLIITALLFFIVGVGFEFGVWAYGKRRLRRGKGLLLGVASSRSYSNSESNTLISSDIGALGTDERYSMDEKT